MQRNWAWSSDPALVAFINQIPDLVDTTLPWLGQRVSIGPLVATVWQFVWLIPLIVAGTISVWLWLGQRSKRASTQPSEHLAGTSPSTHRIVGVGRDWIRCRCGWTGSGQGFARDEAGDPVASTNVPQVPPRIPSRDEIVRLSREAWERLMQDRDLAPKAEGAEPRHRALRLWLDGWEIRMEDALAGDDETLSAFVRPVDTGQMHYIETPAHVLRTKLQRLQQYIDGSSLAVEVRLQDAFDNERDGSQHLERSSRGDAKAEPADRAPTTEQRSRALSALGRQDALLESMVAADDAESDVFFTASSFDGTTLFHQGLPGGQIEVGIGDISSMAARELIAITERRQHGDLSFVVTDAGRAHAGGDGAAG